MIDFETPRQYDDIEGVMQPCQNTKIFGHENIVSLLSQMLSEGRLHHALLFEGMQGIGKATIAFHLAWNLFSQHQAKSFVHPDINSLIWRQMAQGSHPALAHISRRFDVKTEKFKTGIGVDEIRKIHQLTHQTIHDGGWRVVIIDPADDMNRNASNAILKTLEEPPAKTLFILISHFAGRLLPTIRSRCQTVNFRSLQQYAMQQALQHILPNQVYEEKELLTIIEKSHGSVRKAALLLCYGGLEIINAQDEILNYEIFNPVKAQKLAQFLSERDSIIQFQQFCDDILGRVANKALECAKNDTLNISKRYADLWLDMGQDIGQTEIYNLDKKQLVINLLQKTHHLMNQNT